MTAARGAAASNDETAARPGVSSGRLSAAGGLFCLIMLGVALRLVPIVLVPSINWGDEIFQTVEPAHRLVFGYGLVPWEFQLGMRFWLLPGVIAGLMEIARIIGDGPQYYLSAVAIGLGVLACAPVICGFLWCRREFGLPAAFVAAFAVAVAPELVYFGARTLNEVVAAHLLVIAFYLLQPGYRVEFPATPVRSGIPPRGGLPVAHPSRPGGCRLLPVVGPGWLALAPPGADRRRPHGAGVRCDPRLADARLSVRLDLAQPPLQRLLRRQHRDQRRPEFLLPARRIGRLAHRRPVSAAC